VADEAVARYHRLTSYKPGRAWDAPGDDDWIRTDLAQNDRALLPPPVKRYAQALETVELPRELPTVDIPAGEVLAGRVQHGGSGGGALDLAGVARLLHLSAGIVRTTERPGRPLQLFRAAGSAGGRFPLEVYVVADGVWWYDPSAHALRRIGPPAAATTTTIVVTGVPWRTGWRYAERGYRHIHWDAGTMLSQLLALAPGARLYTRFPDARVAELVGADGVHEFPVALVALGDGEPAVDAGGRAQRGEIDAEPQEYPLITATQRAGDTDELGDPWPAGAAADPPDRPTPALDEVILRRGSARRMRRDAQIARELLTWPLRVALRGIEVPHFAVVHGVEGTRPGIYRWPDLDHPLPRATSRDEMASISLEQGLGGDAAYVVIGAADLDRLDARGYREAQLAAGLVNGRLHLAAYALGIGASGMTFTDSEIPGLLGAPLAGLLFTCVGVPAYRSKPGGAPGRATPVKVPAPRLTG
jgi:hypothetical protein